MCVVMPVDVTPPEQKAVDSKEKDLMDRENAAKVLASSSKSKWNELLEREEVLGKKSTQLAQQKKHLDMVQKRLSKLKRQLEDGSLK